MTPSAFSSLQKELEMFSFFAYCIKKTITIKSSNAFAKIWNKIFLKASTYLKKSSQSLEL